MSAIHASHVSFSYSSAVSVIDDASFDLGSGWTGLVGANGAGKSTLLSLLAGEHPPDAGSITLVPTGTEPVLCQQRVDDLTVAIEAFAALWDRVAVRLRARLRLEVADLDRWPTLSPGERKRWQIGAAVAATPDVLLLDEPTNHLDGEARALLLEVLGSFTGTGIVVSHDREVLRMLTTHTLRIHRGRVRLWNGSYEMARDSWEPEAIVTQREYERLKREQKKTKRRLADQRRTAVEKDAKRRKEIREAGVHDLDTLGAVATGRHASGQRAGAREREVTRAHLESVTNKIDAPARSSSSGSTDRWRSPTARFSSMQTSLSEEAIGSTSPDRTASGRRPCSTRLSMPLGSRPSTCSSSTRRQLAKMRSSGSTP